MVSDVFGLWQASYDVKVQVRRDQTSNFNLSVVLLSTTVSRWVSVWLRGFTLSMICEYWVLLVMWLVVLQVIRFICLFLSVYQFCSFTSAYFLACKPWIMLRILSFYTCDMACTTFTGKATMLAVSIRVSMTDKFKEASPTYISECTNNPSRTPANSQNSAPPDISQTQWNSPVRWA